MNTTKLRWHRFAHAWDVFMRSLSPWEQEGHARWVETVGGSWELRGTTVPLDVEAERTPVWSPRIGVKW